MNAKTIEIIARVAHEANRKYCKMIGDPVPPEWEDEDSEILLGAMAGVQSVADCPDISPSESHDNWLRCRADSGWKYGPVKNVATKEHPCMVSYSELSERQRFKDILFTSIARSGAAVSEAGHE